MSAAFARLPLALLAAATLFTVGCRGEAPGPEPVEPDPAVAGLSAEPVPATQLDEPVDPPPAPPPEPDRPPAALNFYAAGLRSRLLAGDAAAVRESLPPGAVAAVGALRRALARADAGERTAALDALRTLAAISEEKREFLAASAAVSQGETAGVDLPGWVGPVLRAVAEGPASTADPATLTDAELIDGTVAALLEDPRFRRGLERWTVSKDVPAVPPEPAADPETGEPDEVVGLVTLSAEGEGEVEEEVSIPVVASQGKWAPAVVEATVPAWATKADSAGGTGAAAVLAVAAPHLEAALNADTQDSFDAAIRAATAAALRAAADPPAPVAEEERIAVELTLPLTARQVADLLPTMEAATDDPARAVSRAVPRSDGPGWRVTVGPVSDVETWLSRVPPLAGAAVDGRTLTLAYQPPETGVEAGEPPRAD